MEIMVLIGWCVAFVDVFIFGMCLGAFDVGRYGRKLRKHGTLETRKGYYTFKPKEKK